MNYRKATRDELEQYLKNNPSGSYRINGQEVRQEKQYEDEEGQDAFMKILTSLSKPFRAVPASIASAISGREDYDNPFLTEREGEAFREDPTKWGTKQAAGLGAYLIPGGSSATSAGGRIVGAAAKGAGAGALGGFSISDEENELMSILKGAGLGGLLGGGIQAGGEVVKGLKGAGGQGGGKVVNTLDVDEIASLPDKTRTGLAKQAKSAGFWDTKVSESQNIKNFLTNRGLAGNTPAQTLENMTQEFNKAQNLKQEGLEEIGEVGRGYIDQVRDNIDEGIKFSGLTTEPEGLRAYKDVMNSLSPSKGAGLNAKDLDSLIMKWNNAGRTASGAQKTSATGIYSEAAKQLRDTMRSIPTTQGAVKYDSALQTLNQILGIEDVGMVASTAGKAASVGMDLPLFAGAGFRGADVKVPAVRDIVDKTRAVQGRALEQGVSPLAGAARGIGDIGQSLAGVGRTAQRVGPAIAGQMVGQQAPMEQQAQPQMLEQGQEVGNQDLQAIKLAMAEAIMSGQLSATEAEAVLGLLGIGDTGDGGSQTESQMDYATAASALEQSYRVLETTGGAGKIPTALGGISEFFGGTTASTEYSASLEIATALIRKALIGAGQTEIELKNLNLPTPNDEPAVAKMKIESILPILRQRAGGQGY